MVCASGCFDLLHPGHIRLLEHAKSLGDVLVVAIESDAAARARFGERGNSSRKMPQRPVTPAAERAGILAALAAVDFVTEFDGRSAGEFLAKLLPDVAVLGGKAEMDSIVRDQTPKIERLSCKIVRVPLEPGYSTALLPDRILELRS